MQEKTEQKVVTRFAPSPTGFIHVGNIRTALYAWLLARKNDGQFILRIEDTDKEREVEGSIEHIKKSLKWLGLNWDQGPDIGGPYAPYIQSERLPLYKKYAENLIKKGFAYADPFAEEQIEEFRKKAEADKKPFLYREHRPENPPVWDGTMPLRFKISDLKRSEWKDVVWGELSAGPEALDDFILIKSDGYPTYNFAHIVDDIEMGVTHVVRGQEFISSTPKFLALYEALGVKPPFFVTTPPIMGADGKKKLGKRDGAKDILDYEKEGYLPETMINYLAFLGFNPGGEKEVYTREELINVFDLSKVQHSGAQWSDDKLDWINKEHIKLLPPDEIEKEIFARLPEEMRKKELVPIILERISKWGDVDKWVKDKSSITIVNYLNDIITEPTNGSQGKSNTTTETTNTNENKFENSATTINALGLNDYLIPQKDPAINKIELLMPKELKNNFAIVLNYLEQTEKIISENEWEKIIEKNSENKLWVYSGEEGRGKVLLPLRVALSGKEKSIDLFEIMKVIGKDSTLRRIENSVKMLKISNGKELKTEMTNTPN